MIIGVAGPYSASDEVQRRSNLHALNAAAVRLLDMGHVPLVGVNAALPILEQCGRTGDHSAIMAISMAVIKGCDGLLLIGESKGANMERDLMLSLGRPVFFKIEDVPAAIDGSA